MHVGTVNNIDMSFFKTVYPNIACVVPSFLIRVDGEKVLYSCLYPVFLQIAAWA